MNSLDGGNLIHITHLSCLLPKEDQGQQRLSHIFAYMGQDCVYFLHKQCHNVSERVTRSC